MILSSQTLGRRLFYTLGTILPLLIATEANAQTKGATLSLQECVQLGLMYQPALTAAQASLDAAQTSYQSLQNLRLAGLISRDLPIRRQQACLGIQIAEAFLLQAEWETRYAVTRNYFSMIHARNQQAVADSVLVKLRQNRENAIRIVNAGDPKSPVTQIDVWNLDVQIKFLEARKAEATVGIERARSALREAMGVDKDFPLAPTPGARLPDPLHGLDREQLIALGLERRGEMTQASSAFQLTDLEISAQRTSRKVKVQTFTAAGDPHANPIPQGVANGEYRPGAIGLEFPPYLVGKRPDRIQRAEAFNDRAGAVITKTQNLITLEVDAAFQKWQEAILRLNSLESSSTLSKKVADNVTKRFNDKKATGEELIRARTLEDQAQSYYNEALYSHALALAALERVTAGGYRPSYAAKRQP